MSTFQLYNQVTAETSKQTTLMYSSSFSSAIKLLHKDLRQPIYDVYGLVRYADEIVDTFHDFDKAKLLAQFKIDTYTAIEQGISLNPILHRFQLTFRKYNIGQDLVEAFFNSMEMDLSKQDYDAAAYQNYIYGSAEVVGLMCLHIFCDGNKEKYEQLRSSAQSLGAAFQKVNFLRDIKADFEGLERMYFPNCDFTNFKPEDKQQIEADIQANFSAALKGIKALPIKARFGVYVAYKYYYTLYKKIRKTQHDSILHTRIRIPDYGKLFILAKAKIRTQLNLL
jgi:phytoene/squalene synthetase